MQTRNICYTDPESLEKFIADGRYSSNQNVLVQVFTADIEKNYIADLIRTITSKIPQAVMIGASTDGEICAGKAISNSTVISITTFAAAKLQAKIYQFNESQFKTGQTIAKELCVADTKAIILLADGLKTNGDDLLDGLYDINQEIVIAGGLAGDYRKMQQTFVIYQDKMYQNSVVACALNSDALIVNTQNIFGWRPIGKRMHVTKAIGNQLFEIDNLPLRDLYARYLGEAVAKDLPVSAGEYPLLIQRDGQSVARAALNLRSDGSMVYAGNFNVGDIVQFGYGHIPIILDSARNTLSSIYTLPIESIFIYSCSARKYFMGDEVNKEILPLELLATSSGFFTYGEFFHSKNKNELLNESMTLLILSELHDQAKINDRTAPQLSTILEQPIYERLFHLIDATSQELSNTNDKLESIVEQKTKEVIQQANYDSLTKLPNRNMLLSDLRAELLSVPSKIAIINIDEFKQINDYYGYKLGDKVLLQVATQLRSLINNSPKFGNLALYKLPVDEFALVAKGTMSTDDFLDFVNKIRSLFSNELYIENYKFLLNITIGISLGRVESNDFLAEFDGLLTQANIALRAAKDTKSYQVVYNNSLTLRQQLEYNILWTQKILSAIKEDRFVPYFQAITDSRTGLIHKYECLIRMIDSDGAIIAPIKFLDIAIKAKLYPELTKIMIHKCFEIFAKNGKNFSINLAMADLQDPKTVSYLCEQISKFNIGKQLTLEVLESEAVGDYADLALFITKVQQFGCKIAIDDFGTGYSNFEHIIRMQIDYLKIDGSLIKNITGDPSVLIMVEMIINFCKRIGLKSVAEFVSDKEIYDLLKSLGVDYLQGYYLGKPEPSCD